MEGLVGDIVSAKFDVSEASINAKALGKRLSDVRVARESDTKALCDDATALLRVCLPLCFKTDL